MSRPTRALIDVGAMRHNLARARQAAPGARVMAVAKASGYGHGIERAASAFTDTDAFAVATVEEALELRRLGVERRIVLLEGFSDPSQLSAIREANLDIVLHHITQLEALENASRVRPLRCWLKIDTGMHRLGFPMEQAAEITQRLESLPNIERPVGLLSHLACADERGDCMTQRQIEDFRTLARGYSGERSLANSAGILGWPDSHLDWVRAGIMLYGISPFAGGRGTEEGLRPAMTLESTLIAINEIPAGESVGYGAAFTCPETMPVGVAAIGYGDGYPRTATTGTPVLVNGSRAQLIGRVSMDLISIDLRRQPQARVGDRVVLWGEGLAVEEVAEHAGTIPYALVCGVTQRVSFASVAETGGAVSAREGVESNELLQAR